MNHTAHLDARSWPDFVRKNSALGDKNTLALPARAAFFADITTQEELSRVRHQPVRRLILGGGSNLVLTGDFDGLILALKTKGKALIGEDANHWYIRAAAGENWHEFVLWTLANHWPGLENLALIPGTVGATPIQNVGAYGAEVADYIHRVTAYVFKDDRTVEFTRKDCRFAYRDSVFKQNGWHCDGSLCITDVVFALPKTWQARLAYGELKSVLADQVPTPQRIANAVIALRQRKLPDPNILPNAGSFFQNPVVSAETLAHLRRAYPQMPCYPTASGEAKIAAGWLIEQCGWKGKALGRVGMYEKQALILVNHGGGTAKELLTLVRAVQHDVHAKFAINLSPEPIFV